MPVIGIGTDMVDARRVENTLKQFPERFPVRLLSAVEQDLFRRLKTDRMKTEFCALRLAAKEACAKALGTGFAKGVRLSDISVDNDAAGAPVLRLSGGARARLEALAGPGAQTALHVTLTDEPPYAQGFVILERL
jgi:holo-[acyl-carrier protein] synthase